MTVAETADGGQVRDKVLLAAICLSIAQQAVARPSFTPAQRSAFRQAVDDYQIFVVPHCAPDEVQAYVTARAERDRAFVRSLRKVGLEADYRQAVADRTARDEGTVYHCERPPPPPRPDGETTARQPARAASPNSLAAHFEEGDRQFAKMVEIRDAVIDSKRR